MSLSNQSIYTQLVSAGMSPAGACALMGNMNAESAMRANNAQDGMTRLSDAEYTAAADNGSIDFVHDAVGYGLCQWTYWARKQNLLNYAKSRGVSVGTETMQVDFAVKELKSEYSGLWSYMCGTNDIETATSRICKEFERPAVNNISVRLEAAKGFYKQFAGLDASGYVPEIHPTVDVEDGSGVDDVAKKSKETSYMLQALLVANGYDLKLDGIIGSKTKAAAKKFVASL